MLIRDRAPTSTRKKLANGFLQVDAVFARAGIQRYSAGEMGRDDLPSHHMLRIWRPEDEVFKPEAMESFASVPLTDDHPEDMVTPENAESLTKGMTDGTVKRDGHKLVGKIIVSSADAIAKIDSGKVELSNGYDVDVEWTTGVIPAGQHEAGQAYDGIQRNIVGNHVALVDAGRCGPECRVLDKAPAAPAKDKSECGCSGGDPMADAAPKKMMVDGIGLVTVTDESETVINKLVADKATLQTAHDALDGKLTAAEASHATALAAKDKEIEDLKAKVEDTASLDARAAARATLITDAKKLAGDDLVVDGKTDLQIQKDAVTKALGEDKVKDKADAFFSSAFDALVLSAPAGAADSGQRQTPQSGLGDALRPQPKRQEDAAPASYEARMQDAWKSQGAAN